MSFNVKESKCDKINCVRKLTKMDLSQIHRTHETIEAGMNETIYSRYFCSTGQSPLESI